MSMSREEFKAAFREVVSSEFAHIPTDESSIDFTFSEKFIKIRYLCLKMTFPRCCKLFHTQDGGNFRRSQRRHG